MPIYKRSLWKSVDWITISLYVIMITIGWVSIYDASYDIDNLRSLFPFGRPGMQLIWIGTSVVLIFMIMMLDKHFFETFAYFIYGFVILLLIVTIFISPNIKGSHSWLVFSSSIRVQPAEFAKFATALALAKFMNAYDFNLLKIRNIIFSALIVLTPMLCIVLQKEAGSALIFLAVILVFYREGMSGYVLLASVCAILFFIIEIKYESLIWYSTPLGEFAVTCIILALIFVVTRYVLKNTVLSNYFLGIIALAGVLSYIVSLFYEFNLVWVTIALIVGFSLYLVLYAIKDINKQYALLTLFALLSVVYLYSVDYVFDNVLEPYQQQRIKVSLGMEDDPTGAGYNVNQSMIAIGSGGFSGKGFLNGTQTRLKYVPEQDTDFIYCTIGEEFGFVGSFLILLLFGILLLRLIVLSERQDTSFGRVYGYCVVSILFFHVLVNIGMVTGLTPVIGIPLPFFSYGGSALWGFTIFLFIFLRIDSGRKEER